MYLLMEALERGQEGGLSTKESFYSCKCYQAEEGGIQEEIRRVEEG